MFDLLIRGGKVVDGTGVPPFDADVAISDGKIIDIGDVDGHAREVVDADGALVMPGWIDAHTHYDGQVSWDDQIEGSASNGVTTVVMGNCGVGFAPVRPTNTDALIDLMEGVEAIPGTALYEGIPWGEWESFPDYLRYLDQRKWSLDVGSQVPHGAARFYVMGERSIEDADATPEELVQLSGLVEEAVSAGALGFSTSRIQLHRSMSGYCVPGTFAPEEELAAIAQAIVAGGGGVLQGTTAKGEGFPGLPEPQTFADEVRLFARVSKTAGIPINFSLLQVVDHPEEYQQILDLTAEENAHGAQLRPMCAARSLTVLTSLDTYHVFMLRPTFRALMDLPLDRKVAELQRPEVKAAILSEPNVRIDPAGAMDNILQPLFESRMHLVFPLDEVPNYEPSADESITARAAAEGRDPFEYFYDHLLGDDGRAMAMYLGANYANGSLNACRDMILHPDTVLGLSDGGAHVNFLCDTSITTFQLAHWVRDRARGPRLPIELVVNKGTQAVADLYGLSDRGSIAIGKRADLNVIDFDRLSTSRPELHHDLPAGGSRFLQPACGYVATYVKGVRTRSDDEDTGARPGRVVRRSQAG